MRLHLAADHRGYELGRRLASWLSATHVAEVVWHGAEELDVGDDYPPLCVQVGLAVVTDQDAGTDARGIVFGGEGAGETIATNKVNGARAVPAIDADLIHAARRNADANILVVGADLIEESTAHALVGVFLDTPFSGDLDDARRLVNTAEYESSGTIEGWRLQR